MKSSSLSSLVTAATLSLMSLTVFAADGYPRVWPIEKRVELKDGGTLIVYKDGKTAVEDRYGNPVWKVRAGGTVETRTGERVAINSNEMQRLDRSHPMIGD